MHKGSRIRCNKSLFGMKRFLFNMVDAAKPGHLVSLPTTEVFGHWLFFYINLCLFSFSPSCVQEDTASVVSHCSLQTLKQKRSKPASHCDLFSSSYSCQSNRENMTPKGKKRLLLPKFLLQTCTVHRSIIR